MHNAKFASVIEKLQGLVESRQIGVINNGINEVMMNLIDIQIAIQSNPSKYIPKLPFIRRHLEKINDILRKDRD